MCVRMLNGGMTPALEKETAKNPDPRKQGNKLAKAKEKYIKLYGDIARKQEAEAALVPDLAAELFTESTVKYSLFLTKLDELYTSWQKSKCHKILFGTTQPSHVIMVAAVLCVTSALVPASEKVHAGDHAHSRFSSFIYLTSFAVHFGSQIWMTFVSGLSLYFALPRHTFGEVQQVLFPRYFTLNACLGLTTLLIFVKHHPTHTWNTEVTIQVLGMSLAFFDELMIRLYLTPSLIHLIAHKNAIERAAVVGNEVGRCDPGPLKYCPHYLKILSAFRRVHVSIAIGNMLSVSVSVLHLHYLTSKLCAH